MSYLLGLSDMIESYTIQQFDELPSTQDYAHTLMSTGHAKHGQVISTMNQVRGYGRQKRPWVGGKGNLAITLILTPGGNSANFAQLSYVAGVALRDTISKYVPNAKTELKWVNDILIDGKKIGGILVEKVGNVAFIGLGANLVKSAEFEKLNACSLADFTSVPNLPEFLAQLLDNFKYQYNSWKASGLTPIRNQWLQHCRGLGEEITIKFPKEVISGLFKDISTEGKLIIQTANGSREVDAGEMYFV